MKQGDALADKVAILGLGVMGLGMAKNLRSAGFEVTAWNRTAAKAEAFAKDGGTAAATPAAAAAGAKVVLSMLADDPASRAAWLGSDGALAGMTRGAIAIESSTVSPAWVAELQSAAQQHGVRLLDAPVTGSRVQAETGQLTFLTGGDADTIHAAQSVLESMSKAIVRLGPVGSGTQLKLINNFLCGVQVTSFAEALTWIERSGLDRTAAIEFLKTAAPGSGIVAGMSDRMTQRTYEVNFALDLMRKDLIYAQAAAGAFGVALASAASAEQLFIRAQNEGHGEQDMSSVVEVLRAAKA